MYAIQCINRLYKGTKYVGLRDTGLPYPVFDGNTDCPKDIHDFGTKEAAEAFLAKFLKRENIDLSQLSTSEVVDIALVNNANKFQIIKYHIDNDNVVVDEKYELPQFNRKDWYGAT